jgi:hypothetical protein
MLVPALVVASLDARRPNKGPTPQRIDPFSVSILLNIWPVPSFAERFQP